MLHRAVLIARNIPNGERVAYVSEDERASLIEGRKIGPPFANLRELSSGA
jgi:hypothetical protein